MAKTSKRVAPLELMNTKVSRISGHVAGTLLGSDERGPLVTYPNNAHGPLFARSTVPFAAGVPSGDVPVLLVFEGERSDCPIIVGVLVDPSTSRSPEPTKAPSPEAPIEALVDGKRVVLDAQDEIVLRCGKASITLRRNGRVVIRGSYVETRSEGVNRIKGGSVQIN